MACSFISECSKALILLRSQEKGYKALQLVMKMSMDGQVTRAYACIQDVRKRSSKEEAERN